MRDKRVTTLWRNHRGICITDAWLYPIGYASGIPSRRDRTTIAQRFSVGSRSRIDQVPMGRLNRLRANLPGATAQKSPEPVVQRRRDCWLAYVRAEHAMEMRRDARHAPHSVVPS